MKLFWPLLLSTLWVNAQPVDDESPTEIIFSTNLERVGDYGQFVPSLASLAVIIAKKDKKGFWQLAKSVGAKFVITHTL